MMKILRVQPIITSVLLLMSLMVSQSAVSTELYFVDAHSQVDHRVDDLGIILQRMQENAVRKTILASRGKRRAWDIADFAEKYPQQIIPAIRSKGGGYRRNQAKYFRKIEKQINSGRFKGIAEVILYHAQKGDKAPEVSVMPSDKRVRVLLDYANTTHLPLVLHIEFASLDEAGKKEFMTGLRSLLRDNPGLPVVMIHMAQLQHAEVRVLLQAHDNIYFMTSHANPHAIRNSRQPWVDMFAEGTLAPAWKALVIEYADRFVFALDNVWAEHWQSDYSPQMDYWRKAMADLPETVAHQLAHGNAERLWHLRPPQ